VQGGAESCQRPSRGEKNTCVGEKKKKGPDESLCKRKEPISRGKKKWGKHGRGWKREGVTSASWKEAGSPHGSGRLKKGEREERREARVQRAIRSRLTRVPRTKKKGKTEGACGSKQQVSQTRGGSRRKTDEKKQPRKTMPENKGKGPWT